MQVEAPVDLAVVVDRDDVRAAQRGCDLGFVLKADTELLVGRPRLPQQLECDLAVCGGVS
jgi:hypothetical protein